MSDSTLILPMNTHWNEIQTFINAETQLRDFCDHLSQYLITSLSANTCGIFLKMTESQTLKQVFVTENASFSPTSDLKIGQLCLNNDQLFIPLSVGTSLIGVIALQKVTEKVLQAKQVELAQIGLEVSLKLNTMINEQRLNRKIRVINEHLLSYETDPDGHITNVSQALSDELGVNKQTVIGERESRLFPHALIENDTKGKVIKFASPSGTPVWLRSNQVFNFDFMGEKHGQYHLYENITDLKKAELRSITDDLTGLYNRRYFNEIFSREIDHAVRYQEIVAFIIIDIDNFKKYNDTYGHHAGDITLTRVAKTLRECFRRKGDYVFRLGGEEFGVICNVTQSQDAETLANITREQVEALQLPHTGNPHRVVTISSGVAFVDANHLADSNELYKMADQALYEAKNQGRNRVNVSGSRDDIEFF